VKGLLAEAAEIRMTLPESKVKLPALNKLARVLDYSFAGASALALESELLCFLPAFVYLAKMPPPLPSEFRNDPGPRPLLFALLAPSQYFDGSARKKLREAVKAAVLTPSCAGVSRRAHLLSELSSAMSPRPVVKATGGLHKGSTLAALAVFKKSALLLLDFLGFSEWALFLCGPLLIGPLQRKELGICAPSLLPTTRQLAGRPRFKSQLKELGDSLDSAVSAAVLG